MEWFTLLSTAVGVILGVGATGINERVKWQRERRKALHEGRIKLYSDYLSDLTKTRDAIRLVSLGVHGPDMSLRGAADNAFAIANVYARRYQIRISANPDVAAAADSTVRALRHLRDTVGKGSEYHSVKYNDVRDRYEGELIKLMKVMQNDLEKAARDHP